MERWVLYTTANPRSTASKTDERDTGPEHGDTARSRDVAAQGTFLKESSRSIHKGKESKNSWLIWNPGLAGTHTPLPSLQKEMAWKLEIQPTILQVWFMNHRAKLRKAKQQLAGIEIKTSSSKGPTDAPPRFPMVPTKLPWFIQITLYLASNAA